MCIRDRFGPSAFHPPVHLINVVPFVWIQETYQMGVARMIEQLLLNIAMFVPLGFLAPVCFPKFRKCCLLYTSTAERPFLFISDVEDERFSLRKKRSFSC